jgi:Ca-activated chloride channel homolog
MLKRLIVMACLGAGGGLLGAVVGELLFLDAPAVPVETRPRNICLVFDLSESMLKRTGEGVSQLESLRRAALDFVGTPGFAADSLSLVGFSDEARVISPPTRGEALRASLAELRAGGRTDIGRGLEAARTVLAPARDEPCWVLLFTDGKPQTGRLADPAEEARLAARACREAGIRIVSVGTGLADRLLLEELSGDPADVFVSTPEALSEAFRRSSERIQSPQMLESLPASTDLVGSLRRACGWAALVGFGAGLALVRGHDRYLRRRSRFSQIAWVLLGSTLSGLAAGAAGQSTFYALSGGGVLEPVLRTVAWVLLGGGVVLGMSFFVPNLPRGRALLGGALGGAASVTCFLRIVPAVGDTPGRLLGAAILGFMAGAMTVLVEASARRAWLVVHWPGGETSTLVLGATPVVVGHSARAHICPSFDETKEPVLGRFTRTDERVRYEDARSGKHRTLRAGERLTFGPVEVEVREERIERAGPAMPTTDGRSEASRTSVERSERSPAPALPRPRRRSTPA